MTEEKLRAVMALADIRVLRLWRLPNAYVGSSSPEYAIANPDWLVKTPYGLIQVGRRKRVWDIDWSETGYRGAITEDDVTRDETSVHAYTEEKVLEYLKALRTHLVRIG